MGARWTQHQYRLRSTCLRHLVHGCRRLSLLRQQAISTMTSRNQLERELQLQASSLLEAPLQPGDQLYRNAPPCLKRQPKQSRQLWRLRLMLLSLPSLLAQALSRLANATNFLQTIWSHRLKSKLIRRDQDGGYATAPESSPHRLRQASTFRPRKT